MDELKFREIEEDYQAVKKKFQGNVGDASKEIADHLREFPIFQGVFTFLTNVFRGELRRDKKTPLVFHSIYLVKLLYDLNERNIDTLLIAALHDVLEDTNESEDNLKSQGFMKDKEHIIKDIKILKEDKNLSRDPDGVTLPERYKEHISRIIGSRKEVINVEIVDRFSDLMDLEYILDLYEDQKIMRIKSKLIKVKSFVENITRNRDDFNKNLLDLFNLKVRVIENAHNISVKGIELK